MRPLLMRAALALVFIGTIGVVLWGRPVVGQAGEPPKQYFPLMSANVPPQTDPAFRDYVGVGVSDADGDAEIYTIRGDSSDLYQLTQNEVQDIHPSFSPDGTRIAFTRIVQGDNSSPRRYQALVMNRDGSNERLLIETEATDKDPRLIAKWSSRGQHLLVHSYPATAQAWVIGLDGTVQPLGMVVSDSVVWSPNGRYVTSVTATTSVLRVLDVFTQSSTTIGTNVSGVWWSPNSRDLLVQQGTNCYFMLLDGSDTRLAFTGTYRLHGWLANGREFLIQSNVAEDRNFYTVSRDGGDPLPLTEYGDLYISGSMDAGGTGVLYQTYVTDESIVNLYWLPFATRTPRYLQAFSPYEGVDDPVLSYDHRTLRYNLVQCEYRSCHHLNYKVRLDNASTAPTTSGAPSAAQYLPLSSNRAFAQYGGYPGYENYAMSMVQLEPLTIDSLDFPTSPYVRYVSEWKYLP